MPKQHRRRFEGRVAVVTGAASGIGYACVERLATEGATVLLTDWHERRGEAAAGKLADSGLAVRFMRHDAGDEANWQQLEKFVQNEHGGLHVLVNNAYSGVAATFDTITPQGLQDAMRVNATGALIGMKVAASLMRDGGAIVNVGSIAAFYPSASNLGYAAAKMTLVQLTGSAALALGQRKPPIRVNAVAPGAIDTPNLRSAVRALNNLDRDADLTDGLRRYASDSMLGRVGMASEVSEAICFLASDEASYITGQCLRVDGGSLR